MFNPQILTESTKYDFDRMNRDLDRTKSAVFMGKDAAFFGPLMCTLDFVWASGVQTAATDYVRFYWDPEDFLRCRADGNGEDKSTVMHELWHVARMHGLRQGNRCKDIWNIACDIKINRDLRQTGYFIGSSWVDRPDLDHIDLEEQIYDYLISPGGGGMKPGQTPPSGHGNCQHGQIPMTPQAKQALMNATVKAIQQAKMSKQAGAIPGGIEMIVDRFLKPKIPWQAVLNRFFTDLIEHEYTWARPNRRYQHMYLPSHFEDEGLLEHLAYYLDISGSISDHDVRRFNSEVAYIWNTFHPKKLTLVLFDTKIQKEYVFEEGDRFEKIVVVGRGGTCLKEVRQHMLEHKPTAAIIFSDLYVEPMEVFPGLPPTIWVAVNNDTAVVPFGQLIHIKE